MTLQQRIDATESALTRLAGRLEGPDRATLVEAIAVLRVMASALTAIDVAHATLGRFLRLHDLP